MTSPKGELILSAGGAEYRLHLGMSGIGDMQDKYGQDFLASLEPPEGAPASWMPNLSVITDVMLVSLERYHKDTATKWLVDDLLAENPGAFNRLIQAAFPDQSDAGNGKGPKARARPKAA